MTLKSGLEVTQAHDKEEAYPVYNYYY